MGNSETDRKKRDSQGNRETDRGKGRQAFFKLFKMFLALAFIKDNYFMIYNVLQYIQYVALYLLRFVAAAAAAPLFAGNAAVAALLLLLLCCFCCCCCRC